MVIERKSTIMNSRWKEVLEMIIRASSQDLGYSEWIEFEPVPRHEEILEAFKSFDKLTRLRVTLRLPNPEFSRYARGIFQEMDEGLIKEFLQDMKNPRGLSVEEGKLPHAATEIAAGGYKRDGVIMEGMRDGKYEILKTGNAAARGRVDSLKDYVRGMKDIARTKEAREVTTAILDEIDRLSPPPDEEPSE